MRVLAIETSCDETGLALLEGEKIRGGFVFTILKDALLSQAELHAPYGGVFPNLAKREHQKNLPVLYEQFKSEHTDAVAVTHGPGLEPALWQGIEFAKKISAERDVPLIPVNHMEAHLVSSLARGESNKLQVTSNKQVFKLENVKLPVLALLISGGHTELVLMREWFRYEVLGQTLDDAVGECFDKVARLLGLPYPGGPAISAIAEIARNKKQETNIKLPRPMKNSGDMNFSFSGLKTAALYALRGKTLSEDEKAAFAVEFESAVADVFVEKTRKALTETNAKTFVVGGGVAANTYLRERLQKMVTEDLPAACLSGRHGRHDFPHVEFCLPDPYITGDNAIMIAECALAHLLAGDWSMETGKPTEAIRAIGNLKLA